MREKLGGIASKSSAGVVLGDIQVSLRAKRSILYQPSQREQYNAQD
jgi:hypothetical protein